MEFHQLKYFVALVEEQSFTRAAERCVVSQPSLSQQIIKLEAQLGQQLVDRTGRQVRPTAAGEKLYRYAVSILSDLDSARRAVMADDWRASPVALGAILTIAPYLLPRVLSEFLRHYPQSQMMVSEALTEQVVRGILSGELDLGILAAPLQEGRLRSELLYHERLLASFCKGHPLAEQQTVSAQLLLTESFVLLDEMHCLGEQVATFCRQQECMPRVTCRSAQLQTVQEMVALGLGVSLIPESAANHPGCDYRPLEGVVASRSVVVVWHEARPLSPLAKEFVTLLKSTCASRLS